MTAALYATRLGHRTALVNRGGGRAAMMQETHNLPRRSGRDQRRGFLGIGTEQLEAYGCDIHRDVVASLRAGPTVVSAVRQRGSVRRRVRRPWRRGSTTSAGPAVAAYWPRVALLPPLRRPHVRRQVGVRDGPRRSTAHVAAIMLELHRRGRRVTRGDEPTWVTRTAEMLADHPIDVVPDEVTGVQNGGDGWLKALEFEDGTVREYRGGFAMYRAEYNNGLARELGCGINDDGTVEGGRPRSDVGRHRLRRRRRDAGSQPDPDRPSATAREGGHLGALEPAGLPRDPELVEERGQCVRKRCGYPRRTARTGRLVPHLPVTPPALLTQVASTRHESQLRGGFLR